MIIQTYSRCTRYTTQLAKTYFGLLSSLAAQHNTTSKKRTATPLLQHSGNSATAADVFYDGGGIFSAKICPPYWAPGLRYYRKSFETYSGIRSIVLLVTSFPFGVWLASNLGGVRFPSRCSCLEIPGALKVEKKGAIKAHENQRKNI